MISRKKIIIGFCLVAVLSVFAMDVSQAAVTIPKEYLPENIPIGGVGEETAASYGVEGIQRLIGRIISTLLLLAGALAVYEIINNSAMMMVSGGNNEMIEKHKKGLFWSIVGLFLIMISYIAIRFVITLIVGSGEETPAGGAAPPGGAGAPMAPSGAVVRELARVPELADYYSALL